MVIKRYDGYAIVIYTEKPTDKKNRFEYYTQTGYLYFRNKLLIIAYFFL